MKIRSVAVAIAFALATTSAVASPYAVIKNGIVDNTIEGDGSPGFLALFPTAIPLPANCSPGASYSAGTCGAVPSFSSKSITLSQFLLRFTRAERTAIRSSADAGANDFVFILQNTPNVNLTDPTTIQGVQYLETKGLIGTGRAAQVLQ